MPTPIFPSTRDLSHRLFPSSNPIENPAKSKLNQEGSLNINKAVLRLADNLDSIKLSYRDIMARRVDHRK